MEQEPILNEILLRLTNLAAAQESRLQALENVKIFRGVNLPGRRMPCG